MTAQRIETQFAGRPLIVGDRSTGQAGRGLRGGTVRRHDGAGRGDRLPQHLHPPVLPPHRRVSREDLRRGQDPRRVPQARGPALGQGDPRQPPDRPLDPAAVPRGVQERGAGLRDGPLRRPGERRRRPRRGGGLDRAQPLSGPLERAARGRCAWAGSKGNWILNPTFQQLEFSDHRPGRERLRRLDRHGRGRLARGLRGGDPRGAQGGAEGHPGHDRARAPADGQGGDPAQEDGVDQGRDRLRRSRAGRRTPPSTRWRRPSTPRTRRRARRA